MTAILENRHLLFREKEIVPPLFSERLRSSQPKDWEVTKPLFDEGVIRVSILESDDYTSDLAQRSYHTLTLLLQGEMNVKIQQKTQKIFPGDLVYIPPETSFQREGQGPIWWILIDIKDSISWRLLKKKGPFVRSYESAPLMYCLLRSIFDARSSMNPSNVTLAHQNSLAVLNLLKYEMAEAESPSLRHRLRLQELVEDISRCPEFNWTVPSMASRLKISTSMLTKLFQREYHQSPLELVISNRIHKATYLLDYTSDTIESIAQQVGYKNVFSFIRLFKNRIGISPGRFRQNTVSSD